MISISLPLDIRQRVTKNYLVIITLVIASIYFAEALSAQDSGCSDCSDCSGTWRTLNAETGDFQRRHEASYVRIGELFYLVGGRGSRTLAIYNPVTSKWTTGRQAPEEIHHFQAVEVDGELWIVGAFIGNYPNETPFQDILIYNPEIDQWRTGPRIPRPRGGAGVVVRDRILYLICGITNGHISGHVPWFDAYHLDEKTWTILPNAPRARDHYHAVLTRDRIWNVAGRRTARNSTQGVFGNTVPEVDFYDFNTGQWGTLPSHRNIPTPRAGAAATNYFGKILVAGGESRIQSEAHNEIELLDPDTEQWSNLPPLLEGRHGTGIIRYGSALYIASGSSIAGAKEISTHERFDASDAHPPLQITWIQKAGEEMSLQFEAASGLSNFTLLSSPTLNNFIESSDIPVIFNEISRGLYQTDIDLRGLGKTYYFIVVSGP